MNIRIIKPDDNIFLDEEPDIITKGLTEPTGPRNLNGIMDNYFPENHISKYHQNTMCDHVFFMISGEAELIVRGKLFTIEPGDLVFIPRYCSHEYRHKTGNVWREFYRDIDSCRYYKDIGHVNDSCPEIKSDPDSAFSVYKDMYIDVIRQNTPHEPERVSKEDMYEVRSKGKGLSEYSFDGITLIEKVARFETRNVIEYWEVLLPKGKGLMCFEPHYGADIYWVLSGEINVVSDGESCTARALDTIYIPPFNKYSVTASGDARLLAVDCIGHVHAALEEIKRLINTEPEFLNNPENLKALLFKHQCFIMEAHSQYDGK